MEGTKERIVKNDDYTQVKSTDERGPGGAYHDYEVNCNRDLNGTCAKIGFQKGAILENGVNGCTQEDLLEIVRDRLQCFQSGPFPCSYNAEALQCVNGALDALNRRTQDRRNRNVEGKTTA